MRNGDCGPIHEFRPLPIPRPKTGATLNVFKAKLENSSELSIRLTSELSRLIFWICGRQMRRFQPPPSFVRFNAGEGKVGKGVATIRVARNPVAKLFSMPAAILHPSRFKAFLVSSSTFLTFSNVSHGRRRTIRPSTWKWIRLLSIVWMDSSYVC